jgi:uncharacterized protein DUF4424
MRCGNGILCWLRRAVWLACCVPGAALGNDSTFGGAGADLVPLDEQQVEMRSEDIRFSPEGDEWLIEARYVFFNTAPSAATVQVGFPEFRCDSDENVDCANVAFHGLETRVDGAPVKHRKGKLGKKHGWSDFLGVVWLFDVTFPPSVPVTVEHRYRLHSGLNVQGDAYTSYVTRTGRSWKGPIGHARFTCVLPPDVRAVYQYSVEGLKLEPPRLILNDGKPRLELVVQGESWKPEGGVGFAYNDRLPLEPIATRKKNGMPGGLFPMEPPCDPKGDPREAQRCLNELYAAKGYPFESQALREKYYSGNPQFSLIEVDDVHIWVRDPAALQGFSPSWFSAAEADAVKAWTQIIRQAKSASRGAEPSPRPTPEPSGSVAAAPLLDSAVAVAPSGAPEPLAAASERRSRAEPLATPAPAPATPAPPVPAASSAGCRIAPCSDTVQGYAAALLVLCMVLGRARTSQAATSAWPTRSRLLPGHVARAQPASAPRVVPVGPFAAHDLVPVQARMRMVMGDQGVVANKCPRDVVGHFAQVVERHAANVIVDGVAVVIQR